MTKTEIKKIKESFSKKEIMDEDSSPEGENKVSRNTSKNANSKSSKKPPEVINRVRRVPIDFIPKKGP